MSRKDFYHQSKAPTPNSIVLAASAVVTNQSGEILLHKRRDNALWSLPGSAMEIGESIGQTIISEVLALKLLNVLVCTLTLTISLNTQVRQQFSICFACIIIDGTLSISSKSTQLCFFKKPS